MRPSKTQGFSMFEILLLLGLISVFASVVLFTYPQVRDNNYANTERQRLLRALAVVQNLHLTTGNYRTLTTDTANQARAFVDEANGASRDPGTVVKNIWGGTVDVGPATNPKFMEFTYTNVSVEGCLKFSAGLGQNFQAIRVNGIQVWNALSDEGMDVSATVEACNATPEGATMVFTSY